MTRQMEAILILANEPILKPILLPIIDQKNERIHWDKLAFGGLSGGERAALAWAYSIWTDTQIPDDKHGDDVVNIMDAGWRDPFDSFGVMDRPLQIAVLKAFAHRHGVFEKPSEIETYLRRLSPEELNTGEPLSQGNRLKIVPKSERE